MAKGDWEVYDQDRDRDETTEDKPRTPCEEYGHSYETVVTDVVMRVCNDCDDTYEVGDDECMDSDKEIHPEHDFHFGSCKRCGAEMSHDYDEDSDNG